MYNSSLSARIFGHSAEDRFTSKPMSANFAHSATMKAELTTVTHFEISATPCATSSTTGAVFATIVSTVLSNPAISIDVHPQAAVTVINTSIVAYPILVTPISATLFMLPSMPSSQTFYSNEMPAIIQTRHLQQCCTCNISRHCVYTPLTTLTHHDVYYDHTNAGTY